MKWLLILLLSVSAAFGQMTPQPQASMVAGPDGTWTLDFQSVTGRIYFFEYSEDLIHWDFFPDIVTGDGTIISYGFASTGEKFFVRLHYTDQVSSDPENDDFDGDGLSNLSEILLYGTNPFLAMTDGVHLDSTVVSAPVFAGGNPTPTDASGATPVAKIQTRRITAIKNKYPSGSFDVWYYPTDAAFESDTYQDKDSCPSSVASANGYADLSTALNGLSFGGADDDWVDGVKAFISNKQDNSPGFAAEVTRQQYRLVLTAPAPPSGYKIKVRVARITRYVDNIYNYHTVTAPVPSGTQPWVDLELAVAGGATKGVAVELPTTEPTVSVSTPLVGISYIPGDIELEGVGSDIDPNGLCVVKGDPYYAWFDGMHGYSDAQQMVPDATCVWEGRRIKRDGSFESWSVLKDPDGLDANGRDETIESGDAGCYQIHYKMTLPDSTTIEFPFVRKQDARSIWNSKGTPSLTLIAGQPDYLGVSEGEDSKLVRDLADEWLGSTQYAIDQNMITNPFPGATVKNPNTKGSSKCNIFVTHIANEANPTNSSVDYWVRYTLFGSDVWAAPLATEDWFTLGTTHAALTNWPMADSNAFPFPGNIAATNKGGTNVGSGHVGIVDYDGSWINAGSKTVNKYIVPGDTEYSPVNIRTND